MEDQNKNGRPETPRTGRQHPRTDLIPRVLHTVAVASGKGGVGKSTVAVNLAFSLSRMGKRTGLFDADIYGPNIPQMLGLEDRKAVSSEGRISPLERDGLRIMSIGVFTKREQAIIWRGPMVSKAIVQMLSDVSWGELDCLVIDLPPGTGDAQLTLSQRLSLTGAVMVTTPQSVSLSDVRRGISMFRNSGVPILGLVENMAYFDCLSCGSREEIFPGTGVEKMLEELSIRSLGRLPVHPKLSSSGDSGDPIVLTEPEGEIGKIFNEIAGRVLEEIARMKKTDPARS